MLNFPGLFSRMQSFFGGGGGRGNNLPLLYLINTWRQFNLTLYFPSYIATILPKLRTFLISDVKLELFQQISVKSQFPKVEFID